MKVFNAAQIRYCEEMTIKEQKISSEDLMESASKACLQWIESHYIHTQSFLITCGMGNNGGDGLALARLMLQEGFPVSVLILKYKEQFSDDTLLNLERLYQTAPNQISTLNESNQFKGISEKVVLIDAVFGTGINRPIQGWLYNFFTIINQLPNEKIAIDIPSGLPSDTLPDSESVVFKVHHTLSFQFYKRSLLHVEGAAIAGHIHVLDIGLNAQFIRNTPSIYRVTDETDIRLLYKSRPLFSHKGTFGYAVLIGGSYGMIGAIALAAMAALHVGSGKVWVQSAECGYVILQTLCPEALFQKTGLNFIEKIDFPEKGIVGIGPGLGLSTLTKRAFSHFLKEIKRPLVLDADALNIIAADKENLLPEIPSGSVLTPHSGEFERLFNISENSMEQIEKGRSLAMKHKVTIVLKGKHTAVLLSNGNCFYNNTGNTGLAKGGSGDVLTGIITGLMAQGYTGEDAAILGVWLHGKSGDIAAKIKSEDAMTAKDIIEYLGQAFLSINKQNSI